MPPVWGIFTNGMRRITFVREPGLLLSLPGQRQPIDYFRVLFDDDVVENIMKFSKLRPLVTALVRL